MPQLRRTFAIAASFVWLFLFAACGRASRPPPPPDSPPSGGFGYALTALGGVYNDGSGALGTALISTVRDADGRGPPANWLGTLAIGSDFIATQLPYDDPAIGSNQSWWWPDVSPSTDSYTLAFTSSDGHKLGTPFKLGDLIGLEVPQICLSPDGSAITWQTVSGANSYRCEVRSGGFVQLDQLGAQTSCDVSALPAGAYQASILAYSVDLASLGAGATQTPQLPYAFDVSEARLAFAKAAAGAPTIKVAAAGGSLFYGASTPGLAVWLSISNADGTPTSSAWTVNVTGPGLETPMTFGYPPQSARHLAWSYDQPAKPGLYSVVATSGASSISATFSVGTVNWLEPPQSVSATALANGGAHVSWQPVTSAKSFFIAAWTHSPSAYAAGIWTTATSADFPSQTFTLGTDYDVYVAATDVDMTAVAAPAPTRIAVSENTYTPAPFTGR